MIIVNYIPTGSLLLSLCFSRCLSQFRLQGKLWSLNPDFFPFDKSIVVDNFIVVTLRTKGISTPPAQNSREVIQKVGYGINNNVIRKDFVKHLRTNRDDIKALC